MIELIYHEKFDFLNWWINDRVDLPGMKKINDTWVNRKTLIACVIV